MEKGAPQNNADEEAKVEVPPPAPKTTSAERAPEKVSAEKAQEQEKSAMGSVPIPPEREKHIKERKTGYEYSIVTINYKPGTKFGLGIKNVFNKSIYVIKVEESKLCSIKINNLRQEVKKEKQLLKNKKKENNSLIANSLVSGIFNVADRIIDVDGEPVYDNAKCKGLLVKALKEKKVCTLLIERGITESALKDATNEMNEEHTQSVMAPPDVKSIMRKLEAHNFLRKSPSCESAAAPNPVPSAMTKNKEGKGERKACILEDGHKSVMIRMDNEENRNKLKKVEPKEPPRRLDPKTPPKPAAPEPKPEGK